MLRLCLASLRPCPHQLRPISSQTSCLPCPIGSYSIAPDFVNTSVCRTCGPNERADAGAAGPWACKPYDCGPGKFLTTVAGELIEPNSPVLGCQGCAANQYVGESTPQGNQCMSCPVGTTSPALTSSRNGCTDCPPGWTRQANERECQPCGVNTYPNVSGECIACLDGSVRQGNEPECRICPANTYTTDSGQCVACPLGSSSTEGSTSCADCPYGTTVQLGLQTRCEPCQSDSYLDESAKQCVACPAGRHTIESTPNIGIASCYCLAGSYIETGTGDDITGQCKQCPAGLDSVAFAHGIEACKRQCPENQFDRVSGTCSDCPPGEASPGGFIECSPCGPNTFRDKSKRCTACPNGSTSPSGSEGTDACACNPGSSKNPDTGLCADCPVDFFSDAGEPCRPICPQGQTDEGGQSVCTD